MSQNHLTALVSARLIISLLHSPVLLTLGASTAQGQCGGQGQHGDRWPLAKLSTADLVLLWQCLLCSSVPAPSLSRCHQRLVHHCSPILTAELKDGLSTPGTPLSLAWETESRYAAQDTL